MNKGWLSIIVSALGILLILYFNYEIAGILMGYFDVSPEPGQPRLLMLIRIHRISGLIIGLIGIYFGVKSLRNSKKLSAVGISMSFLLIILTFIPLWSIFLSDSTLDINVRSI